MSEPLQERPVVPENAPTLYFVDGFHGGHIGHMGPGSMADVLNGLDSHPDWRVTLEVEPLSFDYLKKHEPETFYRLKDYVEADYDDIRVEIASGAHAQAFCWAISGESVIRQLTFGKRLVRESFPKAVVDTYAVQEPCWTSALPQILNSLGFRRASLKNSTCWGGYTAGKDEEVVFWVGPDGSKIAAVPRYGCEDLIFCWAIQGSGYDKPALDGFAQKCLDHGIKHPVGVEFQDLGWRGLPWVNESYQHFTTWREYIDKIADKPKAEWKFSQEDILVTIPWGEKTLTRMAKQVRDSENKLISAEKCAALASFVSGAEYPKNALSDAWYNLLLSQHHDAWICAAAGRWGKRAEAWTSMSDAIAERVTDDALWALEEKEIDVRGDKAQYVRVYNTQGHRRKGLADLMVTAPEGTQYLSVTSPDGEKIPCTASCIRYYRGNKIAFHLNFEAEVEGFGYATYLVRPADAPDEMTGCSVVESPDELVLENDYYRITVDLAHGGTFSSLFDKKRQKELVGESEYRFNEVRGYFIDEGDLFSTKDVRVTARVWENTPLRLLVMLEGDLCGQHFKTFLRLEKGNPLIGVRSQFFFKNGTRVGNPRKLPPERSNLEYKKADHDDRSKLHVVFPLAAGSGDLYKESAFNVEKSRLDSTDFMGWDQIRHRVLVHWVDAYSEQENSGLAVYCDHTNGYLHGKDYPLGLTLAYGGESGFWWGNCRLDGMQETSYALLPHAGKWDEAFLFRASEEQNEPLLCRTFSTAAEVKEKLSAVEILTDGVLLSAAEQTEKGLLVRFFAGEHTGGDIRFRVGLPFASVTAASPTGDAPVEPFTVERDGDTVIIRGVPRFGIRTVVIK